MKIHPHVPDRSENGPIFNSGDGDNASFYRSLIDVVLAQTRDRLINRHQLAESGFSIAYSNGANPKNLRVMGCEACPLKYLMDLRP